MHSDSSQITKLILLLTVFFIILQIYHYVHNNEQGDFLKNIKISNVHNSIKCFFNESGCEEGNIDGWSIVYVLVYFIIGLIVPGKYLIVILASVLFEFLQPFMGNKSRYILNPLISITGYTIGSILSSKRKNYKEKYQIFMNTN